MLPYPVIDRNNYFIDDDIEEEEYMPCFKVNEYMLPIESVYSTCIETLKKEYRLSDNIFLKLYDTNYGTNEQFTMFCDEMILSFDIIEGYKYLDDMLVTLLNIDPALLATFHKALNEIMEFIYNLPENFEPLFDDKYTRYVTTADDLFLSCGFSKIFVKYLKIRRPELFTFEYQLNVKKTLDHIYSTSYPIEKVESYILETSDTSLFRTCYSEDFKEIYKVLKGIKLYNESTINNGHIALLCQYGFGQHRFTCTSRTLVEIEELICDISSVTLKTYFDSLLSTFGTLVYDDTSLSFFGYIRTLEYDNSIGLPEKIERLIQYTIDHITKDDIAYRRYVSNALEPMLQSYGIAEIVALELIRSLPRYVNRLEFKRAISTLFNTYSPSSVNSYIINNKEPYGFKHFDTIKELIADLKMNISQ